MFRVQSSRRILHGALRRNFHQTSTVFNNKNTSKDNAATPTATATGSLTRDGSKSKDKSFEHFPWREKPYDASDSSLWKKFCILQTKSSMNRLTNRDNRILLKDLVDGGSAAFKCAVDGIFKHSLMVKHEHGADAVPEQYVDHPGEINIEEIFATELTDFYQRAIQRHCLNPAHACTYTLHSIDKAALSDVQVVLGPCRGQPIAKDVHQFKLFNTVMLINISDESTMEAVKKDLDKFFSATGASIRVAVDIQCQETFAITDAINGNLLQGSLLPKAVTHQIMLENSVDLQVGELRGDWQIIDIDNWLEGNQFWPKDLPGI